MEIVCTLTGTEGSNPSLSATYAIGILFLPYFPIESVVFQKNSIKSEAIKSRTIPIKYRLSDINGGIYYFLGTHNPNA